MSVFKPLVICKQSGTFSIHLYGSRAIKGLIYVLSSLFNDNINLEAIRNYELPLSGILIFSAADLQTLPNYVLFLALYAKFHIQIKYGVELQFYTL
jgi:hypothetical protein